MSENVITSVDQVTVAWLTNALTRSGALDHGAVESFEVNAGEEVRLSTNARLHMNYTPEAQGNRPQNLFLKMVKTDPSDGFFGDSEIAYYQRDYIGVEGAPLIRCYDAAYSEEQRRYHLLLDDLSATHTVSIYKTPTLDHGLPLAEALATLHAHWWGKARLDQGNTPLPSAAAISRYVGNSEPGVSHILDSCADQLQPHWPQAILDFFEQHPRLMTERTRSASGFTLIHGDLNGFNILVPKEGARPIYLLDRQPFDWSLTVWLGVWDFMFPLVIDCDPEIRRQIELPVLHRYHEHLIQRGVQGYSWDQLWEDYRLSMPMSIYIVSEWNRYSLNVEAMPVWMPMLHRSMTAFDDLECAKLWS
ncbi:MAG: hypothetical protein ABI700_19315 [Chloroflexota bacterium]